ncbi:hypothetical protein KDY119_00023 [Luteimicrobium xylanilyticum]|uniref:Transposase IS204/IS1001/IS1096/IS1165 DDE domain-containing protein n=1 Tax=Luteimicrobium xylanilyticum TaxID=1133546 RepID=A0A5P9Q5C1_9MICO|nr:hypothetical protein KDY119_00023 [Luteimicrobium xylanilyticum]
MLVAWQCAQDLRAGCRVTDLIDDRKRTEQILASFQTRPIPEVARLRWTVRRWRDAFLAYLTTARASNGPAEAVNGLIELHRGLACGCRSRDNHPHACSTSQADSTRHPCRMSHEPQ